MYWVGSSLALAMPRGNGFSQPLGEQGWDARLLRTAPAVLLAGTEADTVAISR